MRRALAGLLLCLLCPPFAVAGEAAKKESPPWTVDDVLLGETASGFRVSPDGRWAVWVKRAPDKDKDVFVGHLMLSSLTENKEVQLTRGQHSAGLPRWSPDGKLIAFLTDRPAPKGKTARGREEDDKNEAKTQVWLINPFGGEPWPLTESPRDVRDFGWAGSDTIVYAAQEKKTLREINLKDKKDASEVFDDDANEPPVRLWRFSLDDKKAERLTENKDRIQGMSVSPDGRYAVTVHERSLSYTFDHKVRPVVFLHDLRTGTGRQIFAERRFNVAAIHWRLDGKGFYAVSHFTNHPQYLMAHVSELYYQEVAGDSPVKVDLSWEKGLADDEDGIAVTSDGFVALLADGVRHRAARYTRDGTAWRREWLELKNVRELVGAPDGRTLLYQESSATSPPRWHRGRLEGNALRDVAVLADLQKDLRERPCGRVEVVRWKGAAGEEVEGLLHLPPAYKEGDKVPLAVLIHGGPHWADFDAWADRWAYVPSLLCARGAAVFRPNYHGSSHYGLKWAESIANGKYYEYPVEDIEKGIDHLVSRGLADPKRVALSGWSNGAILTAALITRRHYAAASAGAGGAEWTSDWGVCDFGMSFSNYYLGKSPLEDPEVYRKNAPLYDFPKVRTPTLLFHGDQDFTVPAFHGRLQFRALQQHSKADVRLILFPGEKHGLTKIAHQRRKVEEELAWFDKYFFRTHKDVNPSFKEDSPLARALALKESAREGRLLGARVRGVLTPEVAEWKGLHVGRFEVTRAQYAQFDKAYAVPPGTENYPAGGIPYEKARAYCAWLSKETGMLYRLGTAKELEPLYREAGSSENTLDHWAGYDLNPEDKERLQEKIRALGAGAPLLKEVGSFRPAGEKLPFYDLGGNVAEWVEGEGGVGRVLGGSADRTAEERGRGQAAPEYIGFRVVRVPGGKLIPMPPAGK